MIAKVFFFNLDGVVLNGMKTHLSFSFCCASRLDPLDYNMVEASFLLNVRSMMGPFCFQTLYMNDATPSCITP